MYTSSLLENDGNNSHDISDEVDDGSAIYKEVDNTNDVSPTRNLNAASSGTDRNGPVRSKNIIADVGDDTITNLAIETKTIIDDRLSQDSLHIEDQTSERARSISKILHGLASMKVMVC